MKMANFITCIRIVLSAALLFCPALSTVFYVLYKEIRDIAAKRPVYSIPGLTFMAALSDTDGNVLHIVPGQGSSYYEKPEHKILTNFSPYKQESETHPWMGWDRYNIAVMIASDLMTFVRNDC